MKTLYLLRHAKAEAGGKETGDRERNLSGRGREASAAMGAYLQKKAYFPQLALISPSARTRQTATGVADCLQVGFTQQFENTLYLATAEEILARVQEADDAVDSLMVVGHNPGMHHAALLLAASRATALRTRLELKYPTCALAVLHFAADHWRDLAAGEGRLVDFMTPDEL